MVRGDFMNRIYTVATWLMWLALPITALSYWQVWDRLPMRMAVHFDANWQPNGYTSREGALYLGLGIMAVLVVLFTVAALIARAMKPSASWPILVVAYVTLGFCWFGNHSIVNFNLKARSSQFSVLSSQLPVRSYASPTAARCGELRTEN
jgi:uncharacterized membrane protein